MADVIRFSFFKPFAFGFGGFAGLRGGFYVAVVLEVSDSLLFSLILSFFF